MPFDWRLYLKLIGYSLRDARTPRRVGRVLFLALLCPSIVLFGSIGMLLDWVFFPGLRSTKVEKPVFVTGHARSGTSLMVKLLSRDRRMDWVMTYEMILPSIVQKRLVRWIAAVDAEYLGGALARRVTAFEDRLFEKGRQMHPMGLTIPEEDDKGNLTLADTNREGANLLALQTRQQLGIQSLSFAGQSEQSILGLFR